MFSAFPAPLHRVRRILVPLVLNTENSKKQSKIGRGGGILQQDMLL